MAAKTQITNRGLELMASSSKATGQHWWLGWYALAYVPDELQEEDGEKLKPTMTKLTTDGDIIYNIFQGDMNGDGYQTTKASSKFKSVNYDSNIKKNYRYVLDETGRNNLVTFVDGKHGLKGACVYQGVQVMPSRDDNEINHEKSTIPLPAPLLYTGVKAAGEGWSSNGMNIFLGSGTDSIKNFYPIDDGVTELDVPRVSADFRNYEGYKNGLTKIDDGEQGYDDALDTDTFDGVDFDGWFPAVNTYTQNDETDMDEPYNQYCRQYWKVLSISNFNKYCAPVNASGLLYDENTGCRNMAKATKYFPISDYSVTSTAKTADNEYATGIKLKVQLKLNGNAEDGAYFKEVETGTEGNVAALNPNPTPEEQELFNSQKVSFKFNRIGIYAVPMRQYGCSDDSSEMKAQYQIDTEAEPVLFVVCEWDSPVTLSDSGDGLSEFQSDIFIDLSAAVEDSSVIRESAVFYNLYEDDALDWYKNQLVANASMAEALVNMQIEMGYIRNQKNAKAGCCPKEEAIQQKEKTVSGLRNLVDSRDYNSNSVRNRLAQGEGVKLDPDYSDINPSLGAIGRPTNDDSIAEVYARKSTSGSTTTYSVLWGSAPGKTTSYEDAVIDGNIYLNMTPSILNGELMATRIGGFWVRTWLYYELDSFKKMGTPGPSKVYDYPDDQNTNEFKRITTEVKDYFGSGSDVSYLPYVTVTKNTDGTITTLDGDQASTGIPPELSTVTEFVNEINRSFENFETKRVYTAHYYENSDSSRSYSDYRFERTITLSLPKIQLYPLSTTVFADINKRLESTGWKIPTKAEWNDIISAATKSPEKLKEIRSSSKWESLSGGTGGVYPLGGVKSASGNYSIYTPTDYSAIYLAIADDDLNVVEFNGNELKIVSKSITGAQSALSHVNVLCVADAKQVSSGTSNYKLGYDSYSLMLGSITQGNHNFNAGENSSIFESANYNIILGGHSNKINNSAHNAILHGYNNEVLGAVHSVVFGHGNMLQSNACRMLVDTYNTTVSSGATSAIFTESCNVENAYQSSILGAVNDIKAMVCSRFIGQNTDIDSPFYYSDAFTLETHHLPGLYMARANVTRDHSSDVPSSLEYAGGNVDYSDLFTDQAYFLKKSGDASSVNVISFSRLAASYEAGIINTLVAYSDIFAHRHVYSKNTGYGIDNSWLNFKTLESVCIAYSSLKLSFSSITSNYISEHVRLSNLNFCDFALAYTAIQMSGAEQATHTFSFGVMKLSHSTLCQCDCSYVYETGTRHHLYSAQVHYATLFGNLISLSSNYIRNTHIYGSLTLDGNIDNHIILGGLDGTSVGSTSASSYISEFGSYLKANYKGYPMIWSLGGIGLFMNKMVLGDKGVSSSKAPSVGDVLSVVGVEGNMATVAWKNLPDVPPAGTPIVKYAGANTLTEEQYQVISDAVSNDKMVAILYGTAGSSEYFYLSRYDAEGYFFTYNRGTTRAVIHVHTNRDVTRTDYPYIKEDVYSISIPESVTTETNYDLPEIPANTVALIQLSGNFNQASYINVHYGSDKWLSNDASVGFKNWPLYDIMFTVSTSDSVQKPYVKATTSTDGLPLTCRMYLFAK